MQRIIAVICFAIIFSSCTNKSESDLAVFKASEFGLTQSINAITSSNEDIYRAIDSRLADPKTAQAALTWQPKASLIKYLSLNLIKYIDSLFAITRQEAGLKIKDGKDVFHEDDMDAVKRIFIVKDKGKELQGKLAQYKQYMLAIDPDLFKQFNKLMIDITQTNNNKDFTETYFKDIPVIAALAMLRRFESDVKITENEFIRFCLDRVGSPGHTDDFIAPIISLNSNTVKAGDDITVTAGVGMFSTVMQPIITIGTTTLQPGDQGVVTYEFKAIGKAGKYIIPVKIEYVKPDNEKETITHKVEYTIVE